MALPAIPDALSAQTTDKVYTISELNQLTRLMLENHFSMIWVVGEISNFKCYASGHWYFSLKDPHAALRCVMFKGNNRFLTKVIRDGLQVVIRGRLSIYEERGDYQLIADHLEVMGDGALRQAFEELKYQLQNEGLFALEHKKAIPAFPQCVGVITSINGAAIRDILTTLKRRAPWIEVIIYPTEVQGKQCAELINKALENAIKHNYCDVLVMARGGGSIEDLWGFNEEIVARTIYRCPIPVVTGIGHEIDFTISDFVADHRAPTPTAAAELISPSKQEWQEKLADIEEHLVRLIEQSLTNAQQSLQYLTKQLPHPARQLEQSMQRLDQLDIRLNRALSQQLKSQQEKVFSLARTLDTVSPLATLSRGYAILYTEQEEIIRSVKSVKLNDITIAKLRDGSLKLKVEEIMRKE